MNAYENKILAMHENFLHINPMQSAECRIAESSCYSGSGENGSAILLLELRQVDSS